MRDIPHDIMQTAHHLVAGTKFRGTTRDIAVLTIAQGILSERDRAEAHVAAARAEMVAAGDGSATRLHETATAILGKLGRAIASGEPS